MGAAIALLVVIASCGRGNFDPTVDTTTAPGACVTQVSAGGYHSCALLGDGTVRCWGENAAGELGDGTFQVSPAPLTVLDAPAGAPFSRVTQISMGVEDTSCAVRDDSTAWCWGNNDDGQVGDGTLMDRVSPTQVLASPGVPLVDVAEIFAGEYHACARKTDGTLWCWGRNDLGELGASAGTQSSVPVQVMTSSLVPLMGVRGARVAAEYTCAWGSGGQFYGWGNNADGQLGTGTALNEPYATTIPLTRVVSIGGSCCHTCASTEDGLAYCFGRGYRGQLGDGTASSRSSPAPVLEALGGVPLGGIAEVVGGDNHTCVRRTDDSVWCWGHNDVGQVGDGSTTAIVVSPVRVALPAGVKDLSAGNDHNCVVLVEDSVYCWGSNIDGRLGTGNNTSSSVPVRVALECP